MRAANRGGVWWLTVLLVGVGLVLAGWFTFGPPRADAQTVEPLDPADCADPSGTHLPVDYPSLSATEKPAVVADCEALVAIRNHFLFGADGMGSLNRDNTIVTGWGVGTETQIDDWDAVTYASNRVQRLAIGSDLSGTIPPALGQLTDLRYLSLFDLSLSGVIPDLSGLTNLEYLALTDNMLTGGIPDLSALTNLQILRLDNNMLSGGIPDLSALTSLTELWLMRNMLTGEIPDLSALTSLTRLDLSDNMLTGRIPNLSALTSLTRLDLLNNMLTGEIPDLSALTSLTRLNLSGNMLTGEIPDLSALTSLTELRLNNNLLTGGVPDLSALTMLQRLVLNNNKLSEPLPASLNNLDALRVLNLSNNRLTGSIPALGMPDSDGSANLANLRTLDLFNNRLTGSIPASLNNLDALRVLDLSYNRLNGSIPALGMPDGSTNKLTMLTTLLLSNNMLTGPIPASLNNLNSLLLLHLQNNMLTGSIPALGMPDGRLARLIQLHLQNNMLEGPIPASINNLDSLIQLHLQNNMLTGSIPALGMPDGQLANLSILDLRNNMLTGTIPASISNLGGILDLLLNGNDLEGPLPDLTPLLSLQTLWLCDNPRLTFDSATLQALEVALQIVEFSADRDHALCTGPAPVVRVLPPGDGEVVFSWTFDGGPTVSHFEYRSRPRGNQIGSYNNEGWTVVAGGASASSVTVTTLTDDHILPSLRIGDNLVTGETYEFWLRAVYDDGFPTNTWGNGTSHWRVFEAVAGVNPVMLPPIAVDGGRDDFARFSACGGGDGGSGFTDVASSFAEADIECIYQFGITQGRTETMFAPAESVSRWQMALFLARGARVAGVELADPALDQGFTDIGGLSEEATQAVNALAAANIMPGVTDREFGPNVLVTRVSMATLLDSFLDEAVIGTGGTDPADVSFGDQVFTDIEDVPVAAFDAIRNIYELGITRGTTATTFGPDQMVTREQMAAFIARMLSHTVARPAGITIQMEAGASPSAGGSVALLVSVRDSDFQPMVDSVLDLFSYTDASEAFGTAGECTDEVGMVGVGLSICEIDLGDQRTDANGDFEITLSADMVTDNLTVVVWTGDDGDTYDDTSTVSTMLSLAGRQPANQFLVSDNLREEQRALPFGDTFELVFQLADMDGNPIALSGVPIRVETTLTSASGTTTRTARNYRTDDTGRVSFPFTQNDPSNNPDDDATLRFEVTTSVEYPINDENTANGCPAGVCEASWSDDSPMPTTLRLTQASQYTIAGQGASNRVIATLTDQYGQPIRGEQLSLQIEGFPASQEDEDGDGIAGLVRSTNRRGQYSFAYTRNATTSLIDTIIVQHTGGRGPLLPSETDDNTEPPGMKMLTHYWVTPPTTEELTAGIEGKTVLIADTANNRIIFQNDPDPEDGTDSNVRYVEYDQNDQYNQNGAISQTTFEEQISITGATITIENYTTDTNLVSRYTIP